MSKNAANSHISALERAKSEILCIQLCNSRLKYGIEKVISISPVSSSEEASKLE
ncbi:MAG: hypothetical protein ACJAYH_001111 [Celeribacter sp.]|jgi:hypothetical protein